MFTLSPKKIAYACCPARLHPMLDRIEASNIGYRLVRGTFWSIFGIVLSRGLILAASILVARIMGKEVFGEYGIIRSTVNMFVVFAGFGLGMTATKHVAEFRDHDPARAGRIVAISGYFAMIAGLLVAAGLLIFAPLLAEKSLNAPHLAGVLRIGAIILFINALNGAQTGALAGFEAFKTIAYVNLGVGLASFPLLVSGAYFGGLEGAVWALGLNMAINWLLNHIALRKEVERFNIPLTNFRDCFREWPILWKFSLPVTLGGIMMGPVMWACNAILVNRPDGYGQMGLFTAALTFHSIILFVGTTLNGPLLSMLSHTGRKVSDQFGRINILSSWMVAMMIVVPLLCFPEIVELLFGKEYSGRQFRITFSLIMLYTCILMYKQGLARVLAVNNLMWWGFFSNTIWAIVLVASAWTLTRWGAAGLALSYLIAYIVNTLIVIPVYYRKNLIPPSTMISWQTIVTWLTIFSLLGLSYWDVPMAYKAICFVLAAIIISYCMMKILRPAKTTVPLL
ncbi:MAG: oligosaccharide flippase family protein [Planctomycetes bacterium]|nr:oligosaccharide flippase family protein [Planctomycetota bacterium]